MTKNPIMRSSYPTCNMQNKFIYEKKNKKNNKNKNKNIFLFFLQTIYDKQMKLKYSNDFFIRILESIGIFSF